MRDRLELRIDTPITDNIKRIVQKWRIFSNSKIVVYDIEEAIKEIGPDLYFDDLGICIGDHLRGIKLFISKHYPESSIVHEIHHPLLRAEGYCILAPKPGIFLLQEYIVDAITKFKNHFTNQMDHLIIYNRIKEYDLDFNKMFRIEYLQKERSLLKLESVPNLSDVNKLFYSLYYAIDSFDYYFYLEPYKTKIFTLLKKVDMNAYNYGRMFFDAAASNGFLTQNEYKKSAIIIYDNMHKIWTEKLSLDENDIYNYFFNLMEILHPHSLV